MTVNRTRTHHVYTQTLSLSDLSASDKPGYYGCNKNITTYLSEDASRGAGVTVKSTGREFDPHSEKLNKYLFTFIFSILRSGVEAKSAVEFRHSTRNAFRTRRKMRNGVS